MLPAVLLLPVNACWVVDAAALSIDKVQVQQLVKGYGYTRPGHGFNKLWQAMTVVLLPAGSAGAPLLCAIGTHTVGQHPESVTTSSLYCKTEPPDMLLIATTQITIRTSMSLFLTVQSLFQTPLINIFLFLPTGDWSPRRLLAQGAERLPAITQGHSAAVSGAAQETGCDTDQDHSSTAHTAG